TAATLTGPHESARGQYVRALFFYASKPVLAARCLDVSIETLWNALLRELEKEPEGGVGARRCVTELGKKNALCVDRDQRFEKILDSLGPEQDLRRAIFLEALVHSAAYHELADTVARLNASQLTLTEHLAKEERKTKASVKQCGAGKGTNTTKDK
ncbi:unnamed protein product, partial [Amoebophrya sp. A120]